MTSDKESPIMPTAQPLASDVPEWLDRASSDTMNTEPFPLHDILRDSLYYPASSFDGDPVAYLAGCIASFIYVDFRHGSDELEAELQEPGFLGYECVGSRSVTECELIPDGWCPENPAEEDRGRRIWQDPMKPPFCTWSVFERCPKFPPAHGPSRFSFLYLCADGRAAFQALYLSNGQRPKAVALIQPGDKVFENSEGLFARNVLGNPAGPPEFLLYGGVGGRDSYLQAPWLGYSAPSCLQGEGRETACILRECGVGEFSECRTVAHRDACFLGNTSISAWFRHKWREPARGGEALGPPAHGRHQPLRSPG